MKTDLKYEVSRYDLVDLCTIGKINPAKMTQVFGGGL
jgi:hypothetical protein